MKKNDIYKTLTKRYSSRLPKPTIYCYCYCLRVGKHNTTHVIIFVTYADGQNVTCINRSIIYIKLLPGIRPKCKLFEVASSR